jgi:hypothetical protein
VLDAVQGALAHTGHVRIDGATPPAARHASVKRFQSDPQCRFALIAICAGGTALTLTAASHVVFLELYWTPGALLQAEDRVHRIGQTAEAVAVTYLFGPGTMDELLWPLLKRKAKVLGEALEGDGGAGELALTVAAAPPPAAAHARGQMSSRFLRSACDDGHLVTGDDDGQVDCGFGSGTSSPSILEETELDGLMGLFETVAASEEEVQGGASAIPEAHSRR